MGYNFFSFLTPYLTALLSAFSLGLYFSLFFRFPKNTGAKIKLEKKRKIWGTFSLFASTSLLLLGVIFNPSSHYLSWGWIAFYLLFSVYFFLLWRFPKLPGIPLAVVFLVLFVSIFWELKDWQRYENGEPLFSVQSILRDNQTNVYFDEPRPEGRILGQEVLAQPFELYNLRLPPWASLWGGSQYHRTSIGYSLEHWWSWAHWWNKWGWIEKTNHPWPRNSSILNRFYKKGDDYFWSEELN